MEGGYAQPQPTPRLRVPRQPLSAVAERSSSPDAHNAGPSRPRDDRSEPGLADSNGNDAQPTPRGPPRGPTSNATPPGEAAARLRALLQRFPNENKTPARPGSPSEVESDFDPPRFSPPLSEAKKSLKDVFSHAVREPGDTPVKPRRLRRNSTSEVEETPREKPYKGKRKSLSDEELEKTNRSSHPSEASFRSSQAATFDILRQRLNNSQTPLKNEALPTAPYDNSTAENSVDSANFFRDLNSSRATPPAATSTPAHSIDLGADSKFQSNLMEHDSEMQHMMNDLDSFEGPSRPVSFPSSRGKSAAHTESSEARDKTQSHRSSYSGHELRPGSSHLGHLHGHDSTHDNPKHLKELETGWNKSHSQGHDSLHAHAHDHSRSHTPLPDANGNSHVRTHSGDSGLLDAQHVTRPLSRMSSHSTLDSHHDEPEHLKELEGGWNKHHKESSRHERQHSHSHEAGRHSPMPATNGHSRVRTQSNGSIRSLEGNLSSSRGTSASSQSDYKEQLVEQEKERNAEREHMWNRPQGTRSSLSIHSPAERTRKLSDVHSPVERSRKLSQPLRPGSSHSLLPPSMSRRPSSRASSRAGSDDEEEEVIHEIEHERERNWNAPIQKWGEHPLHGHHHSRSKSPMPSSSPVTSPATVRSDVRVRAESLKSRATPKGESPIHRKESPRSLAGPSKPLNNGTPAASARPKSLMGSSVRPRPVSYPARPNSPLPPPRPASPLPPPRPRSPLPPLDRTKPTLSRSQTAPKVAPPPRSPERERGHSRVPSSPSPSPGKRSVHRASMSHIPVRTPVKPQIKLANGRAENAVQSSDTTSSQHIPQILEPEDSDVSEPAQDIDVFTETDEGRRSPSPPRAPVERRRSPSPPFSQPVTSDEEVFQKALTIAPPASPPPSPPTPKPAVMAPLEPEPAPATTTTIFGVLSTPTKRPSFSSSRSSLEFRTPSPPHGLPELPDPPSSSDEDTEKEQPATTPLRFNGASDTLTKTPRPPGAWANTPAPVRTNSLPPLEQEDSDSQYESGLATPGPSLSRASTLPVQTPRPPGGWMNTPTPRKSILKVRFDPQHTELELSATEDQSSSNGNLDESCQVSETSIADVPEEQAPPPEVPSTPVSPSRSPTRSPRRSPTIRVVDAFGRPESKSTKNPKNRNRNPVRIVDAMGREVEAVETSVKVEVLDIDVPLSHNEALRAVREGVNDLARTLDELDISSDFVQGDESHLRDLDNASRTARATREELKQTYQTDRIEQLRASMRQSQSTSRPEARPSTQWIWYWTAIIFCQALFIFLLYRNMRNTTKNMFLTTYYDPFYPDLHLYGIKYDYLTFPRTSPTISSLFNTLRQDGFQAFWAHLGDVFALLFADWRVDTWNRWGGDDMPQSVRWPPT